MANRLNRQGRPPPVLTLEGVPGPPPASQGDAGSVDVVDEAYAEYRRLQASGEPVDPDAFCARFPDVKSSLGRMLRAHRFLQATAHLLAPRWPEPGEEFQGFQLVRELGRGSFARVFLAIEPALGGRRVAVKVSRHGAAEARTLGRIDHPNVVPVHSVREDAASGLTAVCMPYLGSATLCAVLDRACARPGPPARARVILEAARGAAPEAVPASGRQSSSRLLRKGAYVDGVVHLAAQLADGLAFVHGQGICHRDLKPSNVLLTPDGRPMLLDFNLAADPQAAAVRLGGTLPYMAPEHLLAISPGPRSAPTTLDARADLFSLGVILYELLTGAHPFGPVPLKLDTEELHGLMQERQHAGLRPLRQVNPAVDRSLARLVESCLAHDPRDRPQSAADLATALRACLSPPRRAWRWAGRHSWAVLTSALVLLTTLATAGLLWSARSPYAVRELNRGLDAYRQGEDGRAVEHFTEALRADPYLTRAVFARGRAYQRLGEANGDNFGLALADYQRADRLAPDGRTRACMGYCLNRLDLPRDAILLYRQAVEAGFAPAAVFNNQGYSHLQLGELAAARRSLDRALALDPALRAAFHNRALMYLQAVSAPGAAGGQGPGAAWADLSKEHERLLKKGSADIDRAIALGPATAKVYYDAARLRTLAITEADSVEQALSYLQRAVEHGHNPEHLANDPAFTRLMEASRFQALIRLQPRSHPPQQARRLLEPLQGTAD